MIARMVVPTDSLQKSDVLKNLSVTKPLSEDSKKKKTKEEKKKKRKSSKNEKKSKSANASNSPEGESKLSKKQSKSKSKSESKSKSVSKSKSKSKSKSESKLKSNSKSKSKSESKLKSKSESLCDSLHSAQESRSTRRRALTPTRISATTEKSFSVSNSNDDCSQTSYSARTPLSPPRNTQKTQVKGLKEHSPFANRRSTATRPPINGNLRSTPRSSEEVKGNKSCFDVLEVTDSEGSRSALKQPVLTQSKSPLRRKNASSFATISSPTTVIDAFEAQSPRQTTQGDVNFSADFPSLSPISTSSTQLPSLVAKATHFQTIAPSPSRDRPDLADMLSPPLAAGGNDSTPALTNRIRSNLQCDLDDSFCKINQERILITSSAFGSRSGTNYLSWLTPPTSPKSTKTVRPEKTVPTMPVMPRTPRATSRNSGSFLSTFFNVASPSIPSTQISPMPFCPGLSASSSGSFADICSTIDLNDEDFEFEKKYDALKNLVDASNGKSAVFGSMKSNGSMTAFVNSANSALSFFYEEESSCITSKENIDPYWKSSMNCDPILLD